MFAPTAHLVESNVPRGTLARACPPIATLCLVSTAGTGEDRDSNDYRRRPARQAIYCGRYAARTSPVDP